MKNSVILWNIWWVIRKQRKIQCYHFVSWKNFGIKVRCRGYLGGPTDIEDFLEFIEHPETNNDFQGRFLSPLTSSLNIHLFFDSSGRSTEQYQSYRSTSIFTKLEQSRSGHSISSDNDDHFCFLLISSSREFSSDTRHSDIESCRYGQQCER